LLYRELFCPLWIPAFFANSLGSVEDPGAMAALNRFQLFDFRRFLVNGGLEQNPAMGGRNINLARMRNRFGLSESIQDEMERTMSYLEMGEDENKQPPVADLLRSPAGTPGIDTRKRASNSLLRPFTPVPQSRTADGSRLHHSSAPSPGSSRKRAADDDLPLPTTPGSSRKAAKMFSLQHSSSRIPGSSGRKRAKMYTPPHVDGIDNSRLSHQFIAGIQNSLEWYGFLSPDYGYTDSALHAEIEIISEKEAEERNKYCLPCQSCPVSRTPT